MIDARKVQELALSAAPTLLAEPDLLFSKIPAGFCAFRKKVLIENKKQITEWLSELAEKIDVTQESVTKDGTVWSRHGELTALLALGCTLGMVIFEVGENGRVSASIDVTGNTVIEDMPVELFERFEHDKQLVALKAALKNRG
jgi:hypothetical protein